jgi:hypothetical protein
LWPVKLESSASSIINIVIQKFKNSNFVSKNNSNKSHKPNHTLGSAWTTVIKVDLAHQVESSFQSLGWLKEGDRQEITPKYSDGRNLDSKDWKDSKEDSYAPRRY